MNYRQWKKNYKKTHGVNPPIEVDKRKQRKLAKRATRNIQPTIEIAVVGWEALKEAIAYACDSLADILSGMAAGLRGGEKEK